MIHHQTQYGFSLIEALVAISLLLIVIVGPMQMLKQTSNSTVYANEQMVAYFLAQEGIELVHKQRDDLLLRYFRGEFGYGGSIVISDPMTKFREQNNDNPLRHCFGSDGCGLYMNNNGYLDFVKNSSGNPIACTSNNCRLYFAPNSSETRSRYTHEVSGNESTPYTRRIQIETIMDGSLVKEFKVTSIVEWRTGSLLGGQRVQLVTYLQNVYGTQ